MISVGEALGVILSRAQPLEAERLPVDRAAGRVARERVLADRPLPAWDNSAMDGYCVRAAEVVAPGTRLPVSQEIAAGAAGLQPLRPGSAARIFTGAPLPPGADTVIMQEDADRADDQVTFRVAARPGAHIRRQGDDVQAGGIVLAPGRVLLPGDLGLLAALGRSFVEVVRAPVVSILSSGDELIDVDRGAPGPGQVVNSNLPALAAAVRSAGAVPRSLPIVRDDLEATRRAILSAARADMLLTSGGVSVGDYDFVGRILRTLCGDDFAFWKVAVKPGKPLAFGSIDGCAVFGLPGNPISALVIFEIFVRPALLRLAGHERVLRRSHPAVLDVAARPGGHRPEYRRASARRDREGRLHVNPERNQSSGALSGMAGADALVLVPPGAPAMAAGEIVQAVLLGPDNPIDRLPAPV